MQPLVKMSLCNAFRFFVVTAAIALSVFGSAMGFAIRPSNVVKRATNDLQYQESLTVELKNFKRPNDINSLSNAKNDANLIPLDVEVTKKNNNKNPYQTVTPTGDAIELHDSNNVKTQNTLETVTDVMFTEVTTLSISDFILPKISTKISGKIVNTSTVNTSTETDNKDKNEKFVSENSYVKSNDNTETTTTQENLTTIVASNMDIEKESKDITQTTEFSIPTTSDKYETMKMSSSITAGTAPSWKKYTVIERKRISTTTEETVTTTDNSETASIITEKGVSKDKEEVMVKSETAQARVSLEDAITSDIPSLEQLKSDLLSFTKVTNTGGELLTLPTSEAATMTDPSTPATSITVSDIGLRSPNTVASKRAGYLDLSAKITVTTESLIEQKLNDTDLALLTFDSENRDEAVEDKNDKRMESQSQLAEDAIKEELLKEEMLNDNEENAKRQRDEQVPTINPDLNNVESTTSPDNTLVQPNAAPEDTLSVKPITSEKTKNTMLYPVNPNYKPLKKIEVQPAKPFVRDPDDNSWRNESLSSLGIVFKPKNSSKPFTQVLKNKTETEWNNISEKDRKSEVPDLRVRLEQIAQKRKSKKKKTDPFGNIFYADYEENSSSEEASTPQVEDRYVTTVPTTRASTTDITIVTPVQTSTMPSTISSTPLPTTISPLTQNTEKLNNVEPNNVELTTAKPKVYNLFEYYDNNEDDMTDYLNMAKIDLKKFTIPLDTGFTTFTSPPIFTVYTSPMTHITGRTGSIQYFPPLTTKRPRKNKNPSRNHKVNSYTKEYPKHVLPISYHKLTTIPYNDRYLELNEKKVKYTPNIRPLNKHNGDIFLTTPPLTTFSDKNFGVIGNDAGYDRAKYVISQYRDIINEAAKDIEDERDADYVPYTQPPVQGVTMNGYTKPATEKEQPKQNEDYDYDQFRKDVMDRYVANFNEHNLRFKSNFPLLYNNSVVHNSNAAELAMSRAYFRRPFIGPDGVKPLVQSPYDLNSENVTVELSPAYELHYYVPDQEEKQEVEAKPVPPPSNYRL